MLAAAHARELVEEHEHLVPKITVPLICAAGMEPAVARAMAKRIVLVTVCREIFRLSRAEIEGALQVSVRQQQRDMSRWREALARDVDGPEPEPVFSVGTSDAETGEMLRLLRRLSPSAGLTAVAA
jgi:hypothetical protein